MMASVLYERAEGFLAPFAAHLYIVGITTTVDRQTVRQT